MGNPDNSGPHGPGGTMKSGHRAERGTRNLKRNRRCPWQGAPRYHQRPASRDIHGRGKLQTVLAISIFTTDKNRNGQMKTVPLPSFLAGGATSHFGPTRKPGLKDVNSLASQGPNFKNRASAWRDRAKSQHRHGNCRAFHRLPSLVGTSPVQSGKCKVFLFRYGSGPFVIDMAGTLS